MCLACLMEAVEKKKKILLFSVTWTNDNELEKHISIYIKREHTHVYKRRSERAERGKKYNFAKKIRLCK